MDEFWSRYEDDPSMLDDIYEREFGEELNDLKDVWNLAVFLQSALQFLTQYKPIFLLHVA